MIQQTNGNGGVKLGERTGFQSVITSPWVMRLAAIPATYDGYREIRKHPTIALARTLAIVPILASEWSVKEKDGASQEWVDFANDTIMPLRDSFLEPALYHGNVDFGYQGFEQVYQQQDGYTKLMKLKPLLQDITEIMLDQKGKFIGFRQPGVDLGRENALIASFRVEGAMLYGSPLLENVRTIYNDWVACNRGARRYDAKVAGSHVVVEYPIGVSRDGRGIERDNSELAVLILSTLESAGGVAVPRDVAAYMEQLGTNDPGWKIWIMNQGTNEQLGFVEGLQYLDKLLCRGMLLPERSVMEGQNGTKAEAETHLAVALTVAELEHRRLTRLFNEEVVDQVMELNFGPAARGQVTFEAAPIVDSRRDVLIEIYKAFLNNPNGFAEESGNLDLDAIKDELGIPKSHDLDPGGVDDDAAGQPQPGMDTANPMAAETRRLYRDLNGAVVDEPGKADQGAK